MKLIICMRTLPLLRYLQHSLTIYAPAFVCKTCRTMTSKCAETNCFTLLFKIFKHEKKLARLNKLTIKYSMQNIDCKTF